MKNVITLLRVQMSVKKCKWNRLQNSLIQPVFFCWSRKVPIPQHKDHVQKHKRVRMQDSRVQHAGCQIMLLCTSSSSTEKTVLPNQGLKKKFGWLVCWLIGLVWVFKRIKIISDGVHLTPKDI